MINHTYWKDHNVHSVLTLAVAKERIDGIVVGLSIPRDVFLRLPIAVSTVYHKTTHGKYVFIGCIAL